MANHLETREAAYREAISSGRVKMLLLFLVCAAPVIASYVSYYFLQPQGRTNYGQLLDVKPVLEASFALLDGKPLPFSTFKGKWVLLTVDGSSCNEACVRKLYVMRQVRLTQGKEKERVERAWLITDGDALTTQLIREYDGTRMLRAAPDAPFLKALPAAGTAADHIYLIDPLGNLVLRFPKDAEPARMKKDLDRLLKYSRIG